MLQKYDTTYAIFFILYVLKEKEMTMIESVERQLDEILSRYRILHWKEAGLQELIKYAQKEKEYWESVNKIHVINDLTKVIVMAETLTREKKKIY